jgi:hypothetical protein
MKMWVMPKPWPASRRRRFTGIQVSQEIIGD